MNEILTIKIPFDLARYVVSQRRLVTRYETNQVIKALDTWLILKAETRSGFIQQWNSQKPRILQICKCSEAILRHRLKMLADLQLLKFDRHNITLASWDRMKEIFSIDTDNTITIQYNINDKQKVHQWLIAAEIQDNQNRQDYVILKRINKNADLKNSLTIALIQFGADRTRLNDARYFLSQLKALYLQEFIQPSEIYPVLINVRPDNNRSVEGIKAAWNCKSAVTVSYWKGKLQSAGIIAYSHLQVQSMTRARNKDCKVLWLKKAQETLLCLPDQITVLQPWIIQNLLAA